MKHKRFNVEQIVALLKHSEAGVPLVELIRRVGISEHTFYRWKKRYVGLEVDQVRQLKQLQEENTRLKQLVADLTLDKAMLQDVLSKNSSALATPAGRRLESADEQSGVSGFKVAHVFSEEQIDGEPLPEIGHVTGDPGYYLSCLEQFVRENGIRLCYSDEIAPASGPAEKGKITLLPEQTPAETFTTLVHEVAHSEMHFGKRRAETPKRIRETEAESVAFVVCSAIGLETGTAAQDYVGLYGGDSQFLLESLQHIQQTASRIVTAIMQQNSATPA